MTEKNGSGFAEDPEMQEKLRKAALKSHRKELWGLVQDTFRLIWIILLTLLGVVSLVLSWFADGDAQTFRLALGFGLLALVELSNIARYLKERDKDSMQRSMRAIGLWCSVRDRDKAEKHDE